MYYNMSTGVGNDEQQKRAMELKKQLIQSKNTRDGAIYKIKDDPRVTRMGHFIRKTSLDELPQFFNAFLGNMSIVGPRPHQERDIGTRRVLQGLGNPPGEPKERAESRSLTDLNLLRQPRRRFCDMMSAI
jgi:hypothetical protein